MNIEKIVSDCLSRRRSQSSINSKLSRQVKAFDIDTNCSFQPRISELPHSLYKLSTKTECSREQVIDRLYTDKRALEAKRAEQKLKEEQSKYEQNCTFQPEINFNSKKILKTQCTEADPFERLYTDALAKKKLSQSLQCLQISLHNKENFAYQPQTNYRSVLNAQTCSMKPIYQRIQDIVRERRERLKNLQENAKKEELQQQPCINEVSERIVASKEQFKKNVLQRISGYIQEKRKKQAEAASQQEQNLLRECTFKPEINSTIEVSTNFQTRQQQYLRRAQEKATSRAVPNSFQPAINKISNILMREQRESESLEEKLARLTSKTDKQQKINQIERELYQQCTFEPVINTISKCLAAEHVAHRCNHTEKEEVFDFRPKINKMSQLIVKNNLNKSSSTEQLGRKQNIEKLKMQNEYQELRECTFKPKINTRTSLASSQSVTNIRGFDKFSKKVQKINQLKQEQKQREQKLFSLEKQYRQRKSTKPQEFNLSQGYNLKQAVKQELREKFEKECTFQPQIISFR